MYVGPCPVLIKNSGNLQGKNPSSALRFKIEDIASIKTSNATKKFCGWCFHQFVTCESCHYVNHADTQPCLKV